MLEPSTIPSPKSCCPWRNAVIAEEISGAFAPKAATTPNSDSDRRGHLPSCSIRLDSTMLETTVRTKLARKRKLASRVDTDIAFQQWIRVRTHDVTVPSLFDTQLIERQDG
jgi:hypothetical protein